jgi:TRAP-type mannitol/chloroaromatic compound transport system permease large subunit
VPGDGDGDRRGCMKLYRTVVGMLALLFVGIGVALLAVTAANGGGVLGFLLGAMFIALGIGRLTLLRKGGR